MTIHTTKNKIIKIPSCKNLNYRKKINNRNHFKIVHFHNNMHNCGERNLKQKGMLTRDFMDFIYLSKATNLWVNFKKFG